MAVKLSDIDLSITKLDDSNEEDSLLPATIPRNKKKSTPRKGEGTVFTNRHISTDSLLYNASEANLQNLLNTSNISSLPSVSDIVVPPVPATKPTQQQLPPTHTRQLSNNSVTFAEPHHELLPSTGRIESRVIRRSKLSELMSSIQNMGVSDAVRKYLSKADELIMQKKPLEAIPCLEAALLSTGDTPKLQCLLWRLLGNAHLVLGHYKKASVCHMHQLAFCRELDDFTGMTMAECNLGITYMKLGLFKLARRCFIQYLSNSRVLMDEMGVAYASSNLGVLSKVIAEEEYRKLPGEDRESKAKNTAGMESFTSHVKKAITYFEEHLEIVERISDLEKQGRVYGHLGSCYEMLRQLSQAIFCHSKRLDIVRSTGDHSAEICTLCNLGNCLRASGKLQDALENYSLGLELCQATNDKLGESKILLNLGTTCQLMRQHQKAIEWYTLYYSMCVEANDKEGQVRGSGTLAELYHAIGQEFQAHEYFKKLADNLKSIGDNKGATTAKHYMVKSKQAMLKQKQKNKTKLIKKKGPAKKASNVKYLRASVEGHLDQLHFADDKGGIPGGGGTWSPGIKKWYNMAAVGRDSSGTWSHDMRSSKNGGGTRKEQFGHQETGLYRTRGIIDKLNAPEDLEEVMKSVRPSFYTLGEFMEPLHHRVSSMDESSVTEYEDIEDEEMFSTRMTMPSAFGSSRHIKSLKNVGKTLLQTSNVNVSQEEGHTDIEPSCPVQNEWIEWLELHKVGPSTSDIEIQKENKLVRVPLPISPLYPSILKSSSNEQLDSAESPAAPSSPDPPPPPPPPAVLPKPTLQHQTKPLNTKKKKSFRGLSIFNNSETSHSKENLLSNSNKAASSSSDSDSTQKPSTSRKTNSSTIEASVVIGNRALGEVPSTFRESRVI